MPVPPESPLLSTLKLLDWPLHTVFPPNTVEGEDPLA